MSRPASESSTFTTQTRRSDCSTATPLASVAQTCSLPSSPTNRCAAPRPPSWCRPGRPPRNNPVCRVGGVFGTHRISCPVDSEDSTHPTPFFLWRLHTSAGHCKLGRASFALHQCRPTYEPIHQNPPSSFHRPAKAHPGPLRRLGLCLLAVD